MITRIKVPPFIATIGMFGIVRGAAFLLTDGKNVVGNIPQNVREVLRMVGNGSLLYRIDKDDHYQLVYQTPGETAEILLTNDQLFKPIACP